MGALHGSQLTVVSFYAKLVFLEEVHNSLQLLLNVSGSVIVKNTFFLQCRALSFMDDEISWVSVGDCFISK